MGPVQRAEAARRPRVPGPALQTAAVQPWAPLDGAVVSVPVAVACGPFREPSPCRMSDSAATLALSARTRLPRAGEGALILGLGPRPLGPGRSVLPALRGRVASRRSRTAPVHSLVRRFAAAPSAEAPGQAPVLLQELGVGTVGEPG